MDVLRKAVHIEYGISRTHWVPKSSRTECGCGKKFSIKIRPHHCRRCGEVFCAKCSAHKRRLNKIGHPDPNGKQYKVCRGCFDQGPQEVGETRSLTSFYVHWRVAVHHPDNQSVTKDNNSVTTDDPLVTNDNNVDTSSVYSECDIEATCDRLKDLFSRDMQVTGMRRAAQDLQNILSKPRWLKFKDSDTTTHCMLCSKKFGGLVARKHCGFCRGTVCKACSDKSVIIYLPDEGEERSVQIAVIRVAGCPEREPEQCVYVRACHTCLAQLQGSQVSDIEQQCLEQEFLEIAVTEEKLVTIQNKIEEALSQLQELIEAAEDDSKVSDRSAIQQKQYELTDLFTDLVMTTHGMKSFTPSTKSHGIILSNIIRYRCEYYQEAMQTFRDLKGKVQEQEREEGAG